MSMMTTSFSDARTVFALDLLTERSFRFGAMGGQITLRVACPRGTEHAADRDLRLVAGRIHAWASRLTRFDDRSELSALNRSPSGACHTVGPTLGALLDRAQTLAVLTDGLVDVTLLDARLAAELDSQSDGVPGRWHLERQGRGYVVRRVERVLFDLDGVGKGWIADRALALLQCYPVAMVDADGDVALRVGEWTDWAVAIADPRTSTADLAVISPPPDAAGVLGIATSGTSVHRWQRDKGWAHHLIDPRTGRPAQTDVVQATVVAGDALSAEALAKAVVISGSDAGLRLLQRTRAAAAFLLLERGELIAPVGADRWLV